jgi:hypothetical protein
MPSPRLPFASALLLGALVVLPQVASAQTARHVAQAQPPVKPGAVDASSRAALTAERQRVRAELERANAEIDALKRSGRGLREDYRLRERLADAEALARRLTELDARLGGAPASSAPGPAPEPRVSAADGPAELDAKADILADQAQRLAARGDQLLGRARDLRARQTLRRRVGQMERDPFSPLEGSKRRAMTGSLSAGSTVATPTRSATPAAPTAGSGQATIATDMGASAAPAQTAGAAGPPPAHAGPDVVGSNIAQGPTSGAQLTPSSPSTGSAVSSPAPALVADANALSVQLREVLDPTTLAELQHLEASGGAGVSYEALERAGAALKTRAERLRQQAAALRASGHAAPHAK